MASALRLSKTSTSILSRFTSTFIRNFSATTTTTPPAAATGEGDAAKKPKRKKKKNFFEVAQFLPNWGVGYQMAKSHWRGVSYQITKINLYKDGRHG